MGRNCIFLAGSISRYMGELIKGGLGGLESSGGGEEEREGSGDKTEQEW